MNSYPHFINLLRYDLLKLYETGTGTGASLPLIRQSGMKKTSLSLSLSPSMSIYAGPISINTSSPSPYVQILRETWHKIQNQIQLVRKYIPNLFSEKGLENRKLISKENTPICFPPGRRKTGWGKFSRYTCVVVIVCQINRNTEIFTKLVLDVFP